jgi:Putative DNA-binding domain
MPPDTFRSALGSDPASIGALESYLQRAPAEWWTSELKACEEIVGHGVRRTVAAMANGRGGELFVGIRDGDRAILGSEADIQRLDQELSQPLAQPGDWYWVDLRPPVSQVLTIPVPGKDPARFVHVVDVVPSALPVLVREDDTTLALYARQGTTSVRLDGFPALRWQREATRARLLLTLFLEFRTMVRQVRIAHGYDLRLGAGISPRLPHLVRSQEDGSFYRLLSEEDIKALLGQRTPGRTGDTDGFLSGLLDLEEKAWKARERIRESGTGSYQATVATTNELSTVPGQLESNVTAFRSWLVQQGILREG